MTDRDGNRYDYTYNKRHNLLSVENPLGETVKYTYNPAGEVLTKSIYSNEDKLVAYREYQYDRYTGKLISQKQQLDDTSFAETDYQYDKGLIWKITDPVGTTTEYSYNERDKAAVRTISGETLEFPVTEYMDYTGRGLLEKYTDPRGNETSYDYTALGKVKSILNPDNSQKEYAYDGSGRIISITDEEGYTTEYKYNNNGRRSEVIHPDNTREKWEYNKAGYMTSYTDPNGTVFNYEVDAFGRVVSKELPYPHTGAAEKYTYNTRGQVLTYTDPNSNTWTRNYDVMGNLTEITDPVGNITKNEYNPLGQIEKSITPDNSVWQRTYDMAGRVVSATDPLGAVTHYSYDAVSKVLSTEDPMGRQKNYTWDSLGRLVSTRDGENTGVDYTYDAAGNRTSETQTGGEAYGYLYDNRNRLIEEIDQLNMHKSYKYNRNGTISSLTDFNNQTILFKYDAAGRLNEKQFSSGDTEKLFYDPAGNLTEVDNGLVRETYSYDSLNRLSKTRILAPDLYDEEKISTFTYDNAGNRLTRTLFDQGEARTTSYSYDELNRLNSLTDTGGRTTTFNYDPLGRITRRAYPDDTGAAYSYDGAGRLKSIQIWEKKHNRKKIISGEGYLYDKSGKRSFMVDDKGAVTAYTYDGAGRISTVLYPFGSDKKLSAIEERTEAGIFNTGKNNSHKEWTEGIFNLDSHERAEIEKAFKDTVKDNDYFSFLWNGGTEKNAHKKKNEFQILRDEYALPFKQQMDISRENRDALNSLFETINPDRGTSLNPYASYWKEEYAYDDANNIDYRLDGFGRIDFTTNKANRLTGRGNISYGYDSNGNMTEETLGARVTSYEYNPENRLTGTETINPWTLDPKPELPAASYAYDGLGRRVLDSTSIAKHPGHGNDTENTVYRYDGRGFNIAEVKSWRQNEKGKIDRNKMYEYLYDGRSLLSIENTTESFRNRHRNAKDGEITYFFQDSLGSTISAHGKGNKNNDYNYDAFGVLYEGDLDKAAGVGYNGKVMDSATGFYNYGFRDYDPVQMRFTTVDPIKSGLNWYAYVNNDPVNYTDPTGLEPGTLINTFTSIGTAGIAIPDPVTTVIGAVVLAYAAVDSSSGGKLTEGLISATKSLMSKITTFFGNTNEANSYPPRDTRPAANKPNINPPVVIPPIDTGDPGDFGGPNFKPPNSVGPIAGIILGVTTATLVYDAYKAELPDNLPEITADENPNNEKKFESGTLKNK